MFSWFENRISPTAPPPPGDPPRTLPAFYWHYARQVKGLVVALFFAGLAVALLDTTVPVFLGRLVTLVSTHTPQTLWADAGTQLLGMAAVLLVARPLALLSQYLVMNQAINPGLTNLVRWQNHWHVVRQGWAFFQNDFAGRIASRVVTTGPSLRESIVASTNAVLYILVYGTSAASLLAVADWRLAIPILCWFAAYALMLVSFVPRMRGRSRRVSELRSALTGRVVDSYSNILTVKLFARARDEDAFVRESIDGHTEAYRRQLRIITMMALSLLAMNTLLITGTGSVAVWLWLDGRIQVGAVAMAMPLAWQVANMAGWVAQNITGIFENVGSVQDGMRSVAVPAQNADLPGAVDLVVRQGGIRFEALHFGYGRSTGVLHGIELTVAPGERIGLLGHSGAGKSTLVNLLLRFFEPEEGRILVDGIDLAGVTQESLRQQIGMVTQDTSLLHRSIRDNIRYGRPDASEAEIVEAARQAEAHEFILELEDLQGHRGYDAHVGERGVKLSGGQRQRIAIARVILKNAPILVLDEATSALDSEVEAAIQAQLDRLMQGRTVIAIAHRLSTIARLDRLVVLERGRIVEQGTHAALLAAGGAYARLWHRQSGGFQTVAATLPDPAPPDPPELADLAPRHVVAARNHS
jgi:ATP-binding cassette subfamily B multidrug efflux pump